MPHADSGGILMTDTTRVCHVSHPSNHPNTVEAVDYCRRNLVGIERIVYAIKIHTKLLWKIGNWKSANRL